MAERFHAGSRLGICAYCGAQNPAGLTALPHGNIVRLHATVRQGTIGYENTICLAGLYKAVTGLPQHPHKK
jgi:hypothetical protein